MEGIYIFSIKYKGFYILGIIVWYIVCIFDVMYIFEFKEIDFEEYLKFVYLSIEWFKSNLFVCFLFICVWG